MPWTKREFEREIGLPVNVVVKRLDAKDFDFDGFTICCDLSFLAGIIINCLAAVLFALLRI